VKEPLIRFGDRVIMSTDKEVDRIFWWTLASVATTLAAIVLALFV